MVMARFGAVAKHGGGYRGRGRSFARQFRVFVEVSRDIGASTARQYQAHACVARKRWPAAPPRTKGHSATRCGFGAGRTPTAAAMGALRALSTRLR